MPRRNHQLEAEKARLAAEAHEERMAAAWERSKHLYPPDKPNRGGRPRKLTARQARWVRALVVVPGERTLARAAHRLKVSVSLLYAIRSSRKAE